MGRKYNEKVGISYCHGLGGNQVFAYTKRQQIMSDDLCLDASSSNGPVNMVRCHNMGGNQEWVYDAEVSLNNYYCVHTCLTLVFIYRRNGYGIRIRDSVCSVQREMMQARRCWDLATIPRGSNGSWSQSSSGRRTSWKDIPKKQNSTN